MTKAELLDALTKVKTRGEIKRLALHIERNSDVAAAFAEVISFYEHIPENAPVKKQIRLYLDRSSSAQIRKNPIFVDESFVCGHCTKDVPKGNIMIRDHCPFCLWGRHLDNIPGDRAANCGGLMQPLSFSVAGGIRWIHYSCTACTHEFRVRSHPDDAAEI